MKLDRPIFLVGNARGGTTLLAGILNWHSHVDSNFPKEEIRKFANINDFLNQLLDNKSHVGFSESLEQKEIWFDYFRGKDVLAHMGESIIEENLSISDEEIIELRRRITENFKGKRFFSKSPTNSFRIKLIPQIFPGAKILAILRNGPEVVSSWGMRGYGFGKSAKHSDLHYKKLGYRRGIRIFSRKWNETIEYIKNAQKTQQILIVTYDQLIEDTSNLMRKIFDYLELPREDYIDQIALLDIRSKWKERIPRRYHRYLLAKTRKGQQEIEKMKQND